MSTQFLDHFAALPMGSVPNSHLSAEGSIFPALVSSSSKSKMGRASLSRLFTFLGKSLSALAGTASSELSNDEAGS